MRLAEALLDHDQQPPPPVVGAILLDTAASGTCISQTTAERLGLKPTRMGVGYGAGGRHENPVYFARLEINISGSRGSSSRISLEREVQGLPDLEKPFEMTGLTREGKPTELIGLMGRDLLRFARFRYDGVDGKLDLRFDAGRLPVARR
jgi:hypothetical protein